VSESVSRNETARPPPDQSQRDQVPLVSPSCADLCGLLIVLVRGVGRDAGEDVDTRHRPPETSDDSQQHDDSEKDCCHTTCDQVRVACLRRYRRARCVADGIGDLCCTLTTAFIGAECVGDELAVGRTSTSGWESRDVNEHAFAPFERQDKAEPAKVVPVCDSAFDSHVVRAVERCV